ncbi:hypothetical protein HKX17_12800 [Sulfitobacter sp. KE34]|jgi:hypothetical protein|uniref:Uncharacterized protein n=1 Tax=Sulfitobacter faviae TaxID=1775881 RepID=A0AAX3LRH1_9RHOB|nr:MULTISPECIES: hypothetical protein [Sulfitobacter]MDF3351034.1 hypothetical protein [Sulfitobacter sp. KE12]MDF3354706.1 hypothetical protein [Sulfitobacter sp. KE27]MDF3358354.1 hypothetical protein [Sulfitobacter sp. KE33]MDF3361100.1 hypothetical protein [Sulfitobacter sp. Ks41]MDF3365778.1 hypothetical protein [Sulfitobacter sp. Ks34]
MTQAFASSRAGWWVILALILAFAAQMVVVNGLPAATQTTLLAEGGFYESLSVVGYILCILALVWTLRGAVQRVWYLPLVLAVMAARELDLDKSLFTRGLFKARQYTGEGVPLGERLIAGLILALIVTAILLMLWRHARPYLTALFRGRAWAGAVLLGIGFTVAYKLLDGIARKLAPLGIEVSADAERTAFVVEEIGELGIPVMFLVAILLWPGPAPATAHPTNRAHRV